MPSRTATIGSGLALAGLGGLAAAALTVQSGDSPSAATPRQSVRTETVLVRTVERRVVRLHRKHRHHQAPAVAPNSIPIAAGGSDGRHEPEHHSSDASSEQDD